MAWKRYDFVIFTVRDEVLSWWCCLINRRLLILTLYYILLGYFRSWHHILFLDNIEKIKWKKRKKKEKKYHEKWNICSKKPMLNFHNIFKYMIFQRRQKVLIWSKGLMALCTSNSNERVSIFFIYATCDSSDKLTRQCRPMSFAHCKHKTHRCIIDMFSTNIRHLDLTHIWSMNFLILK